MVQSWSASWFEQLIKTLPQPLLRQLDSKRRQVRLTGNAFSVSYDGTADVLYFRVRHGTASETLEEDGVIVFVRKRPFQRPVLLGVTVMDASGRPDMKVVLEALEKERN